MKSSRKYSPLFNDEGLFSREFLRWLENREGGILLETILPDKENRWHHLFLNPAAVLQASTLEEVEPVLRDVDHALTGGATVAGFLSYEAGYAFENVLPKRISTPFPLVWLGVYDEPLRIHAGTLEPENARGRLDQLCSEVEASVPRAEHVPSFVPLPTMSQEEYFRALRRIRDLIVAGETYQVNFTFKMKFPLKGGLSALYDSLRRAQRVPYAAFLTMNDISALSFSPELFFRLEGEHVTLKPMKGTAPRGRTSAEDLQLKEWLRTSEKNRAENLMILDLLRNDVGRIAQAGGVNVKSFFDIERYETLYQATSTVEARLRKEVLFSEIIRSLFPCGSVTGAPKIRTMQIIHDLEKEPRGLYTGGIGFVGPGRKAVFSVAIRTLVVDRMSGQAEYGTGSGIVHDSDPGLEYGECLLKSKFLTQRLEEFELIETLRWDDLQGWLVKEEHLRRLKQSCGYFGFEYSESNVTRLLGEVETELRRKGERGAYRVRLSLARNGGITIAHAPLEAISEPVKARVSLLRTDSSDRFLFHKTTRRKLYDTELQNAVDEGYYDVLFCNERGEVTEGARTNVLIRSGEMVVTPPLECGVLPGTFRAHLLRSRSMNVVERAFSLDELMGADEVFLCNALRKLVRASVELPQRGLLSSEARSSGITV